MSAPPQKSLSNSITTCGNHSGAAQYGLYKMTEEMCIAYKMTEELCLADNEQGDNHSCTPKASQVGLP